MGRPSLPVESSCISFCAIESSWQEALPKLLSATSERFDGVVVILPSTILSGPGEATVLHSALRTALRLQRPRAEWTEFARASLELLEPGGTLFVADIWAHSLW